MGGGGGKGGGKGRAAEGGPRGAGAAGAERRAGDVPPGPPGGGPGRAAARGLLDGDGSIINKRARAAVGRRNDYYWEYLQTKFVCGSRPHLEWLKKRLRKSLGVDGLIITRAARGRKHACYTLRYGKIA